MATDVLLVAGSKILQSLFITVVCIIVSILPSKTKVHEAETEFLIHHLNASHCLLLPVTQCLVLQDNHYIFIE